MKKGIAFSVTSTALFLGINSIASADQVHTVKEDTNLSDIAQNFATTTSEIKALNQLSDKYDVSVGEQLILPDSDIVEVKYGDTIQSIALKYNITMEKLYQLNPNLGEMIYPGELLAVSEKGSAHLNNQQQTYFNEINQTYTQDTSGSSRIDNSSSNSNTSVTSNRAIPVVQNEWTHTPDLKVTKRSVTSNADYLPTKPNNEVPVVSNGRNYYDRGQCTFYAFDRRQQLGKSVGNLWGNANNWAVAASQNGYRVNHTPEVGAIIQSNAGQYGHVGVVERKNADGSILVSEMNWQGLGQKSYRTIHNAYQYNYIH